MEKKATTKERNPTFSRLQKDSRGCLQDSQLKSVFGGGRVRITIPDAEDTTPVYVDDAG